MVAVAAAALLGLAVPEEPMAVADEASKRGEAKGAVVEDMENDKKMQIHLRLVECMFHQLV